MHAVTIVSLKAIGLQLSVDTVLTSRQIRLFSPNFSRTTGSEAIEKWEGKDLFSPLASKSGGLSPSLPYSLFHPCRLLQDQTQVHIDYLATPEGLL